ncbi:MAG: serine/threonine protein phosphatase [Myxococcota bacterium]
MRNAFLIALPLMTTMACGGPGPEPAASHEATSGAETSKAEDGIGLENERQPREGLITSGAPTEQQLVRAEERGIDRVISLQTRSEPGAAEERAIVERLGMKFVRIPVDGPEGVTKEAAEELHTALSNAEDQDVILHCASGNRSGALLALRAFHHEDKSVQEALELGRAAGMTSLEPIVRDQLTAAERDGE